MSEWYTSVTDIGPNKIAPRGKAIEDLMGKVSFGGVVYLLLTGKEPSPEVASLIDTILVSSVDHGVTPPSALAAMNAASTGAPLNAAVASGILAINRFHGGAIEGCMVVLNRTIQVSEEKGISLLEAAKQVAAEEKDAGRRISGYGHRVHTADPRTSRLMELIKELKLDGKGIEASEAMAQAIEEGSWRQAAAPECGWSYRSLPD
jgi:citrate synthase